MLDLGRAARWRSSRDYTVEHLKELADRSASFHSNHLSLVRKDGAMDLYHGDLRAVDADGQEDLRPGRLPATTSSTSREEVRTWSYMKFPFIKSLGPENGWYRVGPLARLNTCDFIDTPEAEAARKEFMALTERQAEQRHHGLPLGPDDRAAARRREDPATCCTTRTCRATTWWSRASGRDEGSA